MFTEAEVKMLVKALDMRMAQVQRAINKESDDVVVEARKAEAVRIRDLTMKVEKLTDETLKKNAGE